MQIDYKGDNFSNFGQTFQEKLSMLILNERPFAEQIEEVIEYNFFEYKYLQTFVKLIYDYKNKYKIHPTKETFLMLLSTEIASETEANKEKIVDFFNRRSEEEIDDSSFIKEKSLEFCKLQKLKVALIQTFDLLESSSSTKYDEVLSIINNAINAGAPNDFGYEFLKDFEARYNLDTRYPVSTGWPVIDDLCQGGHGDGELGVVIAPTGGGKSMILVALGAEAMKKGLSVVHYTFELSASVTARRYDSCLTGVPLDDLRSFKEKIREEIVQIPGSLVIKEYLVSKPSINTLRKHLEKLKSRGKKIDLIIVDYADLMKPTKSYEQKRTELGSIYQELRNLAGEYNCPVWTASQTNRSGLNAEIVTMNSIAEAYEKCWVADFIFTLSRTIEDRNNNSGRFFIAKNRNGPDGVVYPVLFDTRSVKIAVLESTGETVEEITGDAMKLQKQKLFEKWKKRNNE